MQEIKKDIDLLVLSSFKTEGKGDEYLEIISEQEMSDFVQSGKMESYLSSGNFYLLGKWCNTLFQSDFSGLILHNKIMGIEKDTETSGNWSIFLKVWWWEDWITFVNYCVENWYAGVENLSEIPGTVGACPVQNIWAYWVEVADVIFSVEGIDLSTWEKKVFSKSECCFSYRDSIFKQELKQKFFITSVVFQLQKEDSSYIKNLEYADVQKFIVEKYGADFEQQKLTIKDISQIITTIRKNKLPDLEEWGTAGSFFKNPIISLEHYTQLLKKYPDMKSYPVKKDWTLSEDLVKIPAAWLLEKAWFKWVLENWVGTYSKHALILVSEQGVRGEAVVAFAKQVQQKIEDVFWIQIIPEVNII